MKVLAQKTICVQKVDPDVNKSINDFVDMYAQKLSSPHVHSDLYTETCTLGSHGCVSFSYIDADRAFTVV